MSDLVEFLDILSEHEWEVGIRRYGNDADLTVSLFFGGISKASEQGRTIVAALQKLEQRYRLAMRKQLVTCMEEAKELYAAELPDGKLWALVSNTDHVMGLAWTPGSYFPERPLALVDMPVFDTALIGVCIDPIVTNEKGDKFVVLEPATVSGCSGFVRMPLRLTLVASKSKNEFNGWYAVQPSPAFFKDLSFEELKNPEIFRSEKQKHMSVLKSYSANLAVFWCPACQNDHPFHFADKNGNVASNVVWDFNHDFDKPTFSPSLLVHPREGQPKCHSFVREGKIEYCSDCDHEFAGKTVDMIPWSDEENYWKGQKDE